MVDWKLRRARQGPPLQFIVYFVGKVDILVKLNLQNPKSAKQQAKLHLQEKKEKALSLKYSKSAKDTEPWEGGNAMLKKYIGLANKIIALFHVAEIELTQHHYYRYKKIDVLIALVKKMFFTFKAMVEDAQREYPESHHHLKTLIESFIYYCFVARDETDTNAKLIIAEVAYNKKKYIDSNPDIKKNEIYYKELNDALDVNTHGIEEEWKQYKNRSLEQIAKKLRLFDIYNRYYRFACEPAHITDLLDFSPSETTQFALQRNLPEEYWSIISLQYSMNLMIQLIKDISEYYKLNLEKKIEYIKDELDSLMKLSESMEIEKDTRL